MADGDNIKIGLNANSEPSLTYEEVVAGHEERQKGRLETSLSLVAESNPDEQAKIDDLAHTTGLPHRVVEDNQKEAERAAFLQSIKAAEWRRRAPTTAGKLENPRFAAMTRDDLENQIAIEEWLRHEEPSYAEKIAGTFRKNQAMVESSDIGHRGMMLEFGIGEGITLTDQRKLHELRPLMGYTHDTPAIAGAPIEALGMLPIIFDVGKDSAGGALAGAAFGGIVGAAALRHPVGFGIGARFGGGVGLRIGAAQAIYRLESGLAFLDYTDEANPNVDRKLAAEAALVVGVVNATLEFVSLGLILNTFKGSSRFLVRNEIKKLMAKESGKAVIKRLAAGWAAASAGEMTTEFFQEVSTILGGGFVESLSEGEFDQDTIKEAFANLTTPESIEAMKQSALVGGQVGFVFGGIGTSFSYVNQVRKQKSVTEIEQERIDGLVDLSTKSKVRERSTRTFRQTIEEIAEEIEAQTGEISEIYWTATEAQAWLESQDLDSTIPAPNPSVASVIKQLPEALASGGEVTLSLADFATDIAPAESFKQTVRAHVKMSTNALTKEELANYDDTVKSRMDKLIADAKENVEILRQAEVVYDQVKEQIINTQQMTPAEAAIAAKLYPAYVTTKAVNLGLSVEEVYERMGLKIVGPEVTLEGDSIVNQGDVVSADTIEEKRLEKLQAEGLGIANELSGLAGPLNQFENLKHQIGNQLDTDFDSLSDEELEQGLSAAIFRGDLPRDSSFETIGPDESTGEAPEFPFQRTAFNVSPKTMTKQIRTLQQQSDSALSQRDDLLKRQEENKQQIAKIVERPRKFQQGPVDETGDLFAQGDLNSPSLMEDEIDFAEGELPTLTAKGAVNFRNIVKILGQALYAEMPKMNEVAIKELVQNSFDAIKDRIENEGFKDGKIEIRTHWSDRTITVTDNGVGMDYETLSGPFFTIAESEKEGTRDTGGFGIAKTLFLYGSDGVEVTTVRDGVMLTFAATNEELLDSGGEGGTPIHIDRQFVGTDVEPGTTVTVRIPEKYTKVMFGEEVERDIPWPDAAAARAVLKHSPLLEKIVVTVQEEDSDVETLRIGTNFDTSNFSSLGSLKFAWGDAELLISKEPQEQGTQGDNLHIMVNGLWQLDRNIKIDPGDLNSPSVPRTFYLNLIPAAKPESADYPMDLNRQGLRPFAAKDIAQLELYMRRVFGVDSFIAKAKSFGFVRQINSDGTFTDAIDMKPDTPEMERLSFNFSDSDSVEVSDGKMSLNGAELPVLDNDSFRSLGLDLNDFTIDEGLVDTNKALIHSGVVRTSDGKPLLEILIDEFGEKRVAKYLNGISQIFLSLRSTVAQIGQPGFEDLNGIAIGTTFDMAAGDFEGAGAGATFGINTKVPVQAMLINPGQTRVDEQSTDAFGSVGNTLIGSGLNRQRASHLILTMIHEMAHHIERNHYEGFGIILQHLASRLIGGRDMTALVSALEEHLGANSDIYNSASEKLWDRSFSNPGNTLNSVGTSESDTISGTPDSDAGTGGGDAEGTGTSGEVSGTGEAVEGAEGISEEGTDARSVAPPGSVAPNSGDGSLLNQLFRQDVRGEIQFDDDAQSAVMRLAEANDLTTFLHETGHLFLEMERRFFNDPAISDEAKADGQIILDWLGVDTFEDIGDAEHEKWAVGFEAYLNEGKAPSAELRSVFRRFSAWITKVYEGVRSLNLNVSLSPEIIGVMDRMLATEEQIAEVKAQSALEPLFKTAEEADMTPKKFGEYQRETQGAAEEKLRTKLLAQLKRIATKEWRKELFAVQKEVGEELAAEPLYRAIAFFQASTPPEGFTENKLDRQAVYEMLGLVPAKEPKSNATGEVDTDIDSLSVAIAKKGGLDRTEAEAQGIDPAIWRNIIREKFDKKTKRMVMRSVPNPENMAVGLLRIFKKDGGKTFDGMRETLSELGYIDGDSTASDFLDKVLEDLSGNTQYSIHADFSLLFENPEETETERLVVPAQLRGLTKEGGLHPDAGADLFGFSSGRELVNQIVNTPTLTFATVRRANRVMVERNGDILNDGSLEQEAQEASHNTEQGSALLKELRALSGQTDVQAISERQAIEDAAERIIGNKRNSDLRPARYHSAEVKAGQEAALAKDAGNLKEAQEAKQKQIFNFYLWRAATAARKSHDKMQKKLDGMKARKYSDNDVNPKYVGRFKQLLQAYNFKRTQRKDRQIAQAELEAVKGWIKEQQTDSESPANIIDADALVEIVHFKDMTLDQLQAVHDIATSLLFAGRKNADVKKHLFNKQMKAVAANIDKMTKPKNQLGTEDTKFREGRIWARAVTAYHRKFESLVREADGFEDLGPLWKLMVQPLLRANNKQLQMQEQAHDDLEAVFTDHKGLFGTFDVGNEKINRLGDSVFNPNADRRTFEFESGQKVTLSLGGRISMALNWGNEGNRVALLNMASTPLTQRDVEMVLASLSDFDFDLVQDIWNYIDTFWDQIKELEKSFTGVAPAKVEASEFKTSTGRVMKGGYYPLVADSALDFHASEQQIEARAKRMAGGGTLRAMTAHGHTIERRNFMGKDIDLNISVLFRHIDTVIHDLSHRRAVVDVDRVLRSRRIAAALTNSLGQEAYKAMKFQLTTVAAGHQHPKELGGFERALRYTRLALTYGALGFSLKTGFSQMLGLGTAIGEFGAEDVARGVMNFYANPIANEKFITENSVYMRDRIKTVNRDTGEILRGLKGDTVMNAVRESAFYFLLAGDLFISRPVWWGQYEVGMDRVADPAFEGFTTEQDAIDWADRSVARTQQSGLLMDLASVESKNEFIKMWTVMYSAFSAIYNIAVEQEKKAGIGKINRVQMVYNLFWILVIPPLFEELMVGREEPDEDELLLLNKRNLKAVAGFSLGTMAFLRELGWLMQSGQNSQLPVQRALRSPFDLANQIEQGELDDAMIRSMTGVASLLHIPGASQINRSWTYWSDYQERAAEGRGSNRAEFEVWEFLLTGPREDE